MAKILVVDDDADSREVVSGYLSKGGHTVVIAANGREALDALETTEAAPDLILLDMRMPGLDGMGVLNVLRSYLRWATIPVAIFTAFPEDPRLWHVADQGVERVFTKSRTCLSEVLAWIDQRTSRNLDQLRQGPAAPHLGT